MNPHFLFNSLNSLRGMITENPACAQDMVTRLANILRHNLVRDSRATTETLSEQVELASVMHHVIEAARPLAEDHAHRIEVKLPDEAVYINGDPVRLAQVFGNRLLNEAVFAVDVGKRHWNALTTCYDIILNFGLSLLRKPIIPPS